MRTNLSKTIILLLTCLTFSTAFAQSPEAISYQAVIRNSENTLVTNQSVGMQISILQGSASCSAVYIETQNPTSNANGLVSIEIGKGTSSDDFSAIDWGANSYFIKTETDPNGGTNYTITGVSQLLSVPYALHAKTVENLDYSDVQNTPDISGIASNAQAIQDTASQIRNDIPTDNSQLINGAGYIASYTESDPVFASDSSTFKTAIRNNSQAIIDTASIIRAAIPTDNNQLANGAGYITTYAESDPIFIADSATFKTAIRNNSQAIMDTASQIRADLSPTHYVGELYGGGIVFWVDYTGEHGLIASLDDLDGGNGAIWGLYTDVPNCESMTNGASNTSSIMAASPAAGSAAVLCNEYTGGGFNDWYLPSVRELILLCSQDMFIDDILDNDAGVTTNGFSQDWISPTYGRYWSSTESLNNSIAWVYKFANNYSEPAGKSDTYKVRAIRTF